MIGFDRPLKPLWIYQFSRVVKVGDRISNHNDEFNKILWELEGKEGKRKVRTVLSRYFLKSEENSDSNYVEYTPFIELCKKYPLEEIKPLLLFYLLIRSQVLRILTKMIYEIYGNKENINYSFLRKKIIERFGERDISSRSLRNLLFTLLNFEVLNEDSGNKYVWNKLLPVNEINACYMLKLYLTEYLKSPIVNLDDIESYLFVYFKMPDIEQIISKYDRKLWEYNIRINQKMVLLDKNYEWDYENLQDLDRNYNKK